MTDCVSAKACRCTAAGDRRKKYGDLCGTAFAVDQFLTAAEGGFGVAGVDTRPDADHTPSLRDASGSHTGCAPLAAPQMILLSDRSARALPGVLWRVLTESCDWDLARSTAFKIEIVAPHLGLLPSVDPPRSWDTTKATFFSKQFGRSCQTRSRTWPVKRRLFVGGQGLTSRNSKWGRQGCCRPRVPLGSGRRPHQESKKVMQKKGGRAFVERTESVQ